MTTTYTRLELNWSRPPYIVDRCDDCGALVHGRTQHDAWHALVNPAVDPHWHEHDPLDIYDQPSEAERVTHPEAEL